MVLTSQVREWSHFLIVFTKFTQVFERYVIHLTIQISDNGWIFDFAKKNQTKNGPLSHKLDKCLVFK